MLVPKLRFKRDDGSEYFEWNTQKLSAVSSRITRKNKGNVTDIPLTIASLYGLVDQREYFKKTIASQNMEGYYLLHNGEFAYNKSYSKGFDFGAIKRLDRYDCGALSTLYICFTVNDKVDSDFMTHYFDSQKWNKEVSIRCAEGARNHGLLNISTEDFFDIDMTLPTNLEEQQKIADFLSAVDEVIAQSQAEVQNLEQQKKAAMQKIFSQEVRFKREDGTDYPEWEEKAVIDVASLINGRAYKSEEFQKEGKYLILRVGNLFTNDTVYYSDLELEADKYIDEGDLIYAWSATFGARIYHGEKCIYHYHIWKVVPHSIDKIYLLYALNNDVQFISSELNGGTMHHLTKSEMEKRILFVPCLEEQQKIADFLSAYDEAISYAKQELEHWKQLKKGLLQQMFV